MAHKPVAAELGQIDSKFTPAFISKIRTADRKRAGKKPGKRGPKPMGHDFGNPLLPQTGFASAFPIFKAANELLKLAGSKAVAREVLDMMAALRS